MIRQEELFQSPELCCGCEACVNVCPKSVLEMRLDGEGFRYPQVADPEACVDCHACQRVCPVKHAGELKAHFTEARCGWAKDAEDVVKSASGGFASALARHFLERNGVVYGVAYSEDFRQARYLRLDTACELDRLRGSKYFQARKNDSFRRIREDLKTRDVLFIGTPCDCAALQRFVPDRSRLTVVSLICHGPTSELVQRRFCDALEARQGSRITDFSMRHKKDGKWKPYYISAHFENGGEYLEPFNKTDYNKAFLYFKRPSCTECPFKKTHYACDLIIGDHHGADPGTPEYNEHGVSVMFVLTERGRALLDEMADAFPMRPLKLSRCLGQQGIVAPVPGLDDRAGFAAVLAQDGLAAACALDTVGRREALNRSGAYKRRRKRRQLLWRLLRI